MVKTYKVFICHSWDYVDDLMNLRRLLNNRPYFYAVYEEVPPHEAINSANDNYIKLKIRERIKKSDKRITLIPATYNLTHIIKQCYCNLSYFTIPHANLAQAECIVCGVPSIVGKTDEPLEYSLEGTLSALYNFDSIDDLSIH